MHKVYKMRLKRSIVFVDTVRICRHVPVLLFFLLRPSFVSQICGSVDDCNGNMRWNSFSWILIGRWFHVSAYRFYGNDPMCLTIHAFVNGSYKTQNTCGLIEKYFFFLKKRLYNTFFGPNHKKTFCILNAISTLFSPPLDHLIQNLFYYYCLLKRIGLKSSNEKWSGFVNVYIRTERDRPS